MKRDELYLALTGIDEKYIEEAARDIQRGRKRIQPYLLRFAALAACAALVVTLPFLWMTMAPKGGSSAAAEDTAGFYAGSNDVPELMPQESEPAENIPSDEEDRTDSGFGGVKEEGKSEDAATAPWSSIRYAVSLTILSAEGDEVTVTDAETLDQLRNGLLNVSYRQGAQYNGSEWLYRLDWFNENGRRLHRLTVLPDGTLVYGGSIYAPVGEKVLNPDDLAACFP